MKNLMLGLIILMATPLVQADFAQKSIRYKSFSDLISFFDRNKNGYSECAQYTRDNAGSFGYNSPLLGIPLSQDPNFDFLNKYMGCLKKIDFHKNWQKLPEALQNAAGGFYSGTLKDTPEEILKTIIKEITLRAIGPEAVVVSYGYVKSQEKFTDIIYQSALEQLDEGASMQDYYKSVFTLIHLRDEYLRY